MSKLWVCMGINGMPVAVDKCEFRPTVSPVRGAEWIRVFKQGEMTELEQLESKIIAHQEALRPLLDKWSEMRRT